jgi:hypothetical protein
MNRCCSVLAAVVILVAIPVLTVSGCRSQQDAVDATAPASGEPLVRRTEKGPVTLTVSVTPPKPRLSDLVEMTIEVTAEPDVKIRPPAFGAAVGDFLVRDYSERSPRTGGETESGTAGGNASETKAVTRRFTYQLEPVHSGVHLIRAISVEFVDERPASEAKGKTSQIQSEPIEVEVISDSGDQLPDLANLEPMVPPQSIERSGRFWWSIPIFIVAAGVVAWVWRTRRRRTSEQVVQPPSPEDVAHAALAQLLTENLPAQGLFRDFYVRLTGIVRIYIEGTTGLKAPEQTTEEFLSAMRQQKMFTTERSVRLSEFLEAADMVKYAGQQPGADQVEISIARAREFVDAH